MNKCLYLGGGEGEGVGLEVRGEFMVRDGGKMGVNA